MNTQDTFRRRFNPDAQVAACLISALSLLSPVGCSGTEADNPVIDSTQLEALLDKTKLSLSVKGAEVEVTASAGAVRSAAAEVTLTNVTTGEAVSTQSAKDGSFAVSIAGTGDDEYSVSVLADGKSDSTELKVSSGGGGDDTLNGRRFLLDSSTGFAAVVDTQPSVFFDDAGTNFGFNAGCNGHSGDFSQCDGRLCLSAFGSTAIGCRPELQAQDDWLANFFMSTPLMNLDAATLTFTSDAATLVFLDRELADPDRPLVGTLWTIDTYFSAEGVSSWNLVVFPTLEFSQDGTLSGFDGCGEIDAQYERSANQLVLSGLGASAADCERPAADSRDHIRQVLIGEEAVTFDIESTRLTIMRGTLGFGATSKPTDNGEPAEF